MITALIVGVETPVVLALSLVLGLWLMYAIVADLWRLPMIITLQPARTATIALVIGLPLYVGFVALLGVNHLIGELFISVTLLARPLAIVVSWWTWRRASPDIRKAAAAIRNELLRQRDGRAVSPDRFWFSFVFDVERARRREAYEPPPI